MRGARKWVAVLVVLLAGPLLCAWFFIEGERVLHSKRSALEQKLPRLLAADALVALPLLESHPLFAAPSGDDAGAFLNERLGWEGDDPGTLLTEACRAVVRGAGTEWRSLDRKSVAGCDVSWLPGLRAFGRWSLNSRFRSGLPPGPRTQFGLPNYIDLQTAAKVHLLLSDEPEAAAQDVRHLARLFFTQHYLLSTMFGIALLSVEAGSWEAASTKWSAPPLSTSERDAVRRHLFSAVYALNDLAPPELGSSLIREVPGFRRCVLLTESAFMRKELTLPETNECALDQARFELQHPFVQTPPEDSELLSWPARLGGRIARYTMPERHARISVLLASADGLPAGDRWDELISEAVDRAMAPR